MGKKRISELTPEQISRFPEFVDKWTSIGLCTSPADRSAAEAGVVLAYQAAKLKPPRRIVWCGSPLSQGLTWAFIEELNKQSKSDNFAGNSVRNSVESSVWNSVWNSVESSVRNSVVNSVVNSVWNSVWNSVESSVRNSVESSVRNSVVNSVVNSVRNSVWNSVESSVRNSVVNSVVNSVRNSVYGQHDVGWLGTYEYFATVCGLVDETAMLCGLLQTAQSAGWWLPYDEICWISERHNILNRDDRGRLHCVDGPALAYPDGWEIYSISGVVVDESIVMSPEKQSADDIVAEGNAEIRRIRIERFAGAKKSASEGWQRYLTAVNAVVVDRRRNDVEGTREVLMRTGNETVLICHCPSTARIYAMEVPNEIQTAEQAQNYLWSGSRTAGLIGRPPGSIGRT